MLQRDIFYQHCFAIGGKRNFSGSYKWKSRQDFAAKANGRKIHLSYNETCSNIVLKRIVNESFLVGTNEKINEKLFEEDIRTKFLPR